MAHHLARLMEDAQTATGKARPVAEERCRSAILALWRHRSELNEPRPLQSADDITRAIRGLYDGKGRWFFFLDDPETIGDRMIELAQRVNEGARIALRYLLAASFLHKAQGEQQWYDPELLRLYNNLDDMKSVMTVLADADIFFGERDELSDDQRRLRNELKEKMTSLGQLASELAKTL